MTGFASPNDGIAGGVSPRLAETPQSLDVGRIKRREHLVPATFCDGGRGCGHAPTLNRQPPTRYGRRAAEAEVQIKPGFPVTVCDAKIVDLAEATAAFGKASSLRMTNLAMSSEDFAYVLQKTPGAMAFLGSAFKDGSFRDCCTIHSGNLVIDDTAMARGVAMNCAFAEAFLNQPV